MKMNSFLISKSDDAAYESVEGDEEDASLEGQPQNTSNLKMLLKIQQWGVAVTCISIFSTALIATILLLHLAQTSRLGRYANNSPTKGAHPEATAIGNFTIGFDGCGSSPSEARSLGCSFDIFANAWIPASCYNALVASDSESGNTYPIFWDSNHTHPATQEDMELAAFANSRDITSLQYFHAASEWHVAHCLHLWRLAASAAESLTKGVKGVGIYAKAADLHHAMHCSKIIMGFGQKAGKDGAIAPVIGRCVGMDEMWNLSYGKM
ncbi:uncharacterized protein BHQ10_003446 [Talaromyces amestolkiae]|uniref:Uncharacterized protein n=1 Tax=Talaromyces amestolkiae TaxID=1196081 RepID=A0A364KV58_TALAM|nr:uncharacterized protein BHQ10_003446 [Talaromyces amestolkiae]RAO67434.1 hypothetical protein BHQ10_003446 [Talaromyces amestolkiae]